MTKVGDWVLDAEHNELRRGGESQRLEPKVIEVLVQLARRQGRVVGREELLAAVWPGVVVGDDALTQAIIKLRKGLGDDAHKPRYIETISKRGYRLIAPVEGAAPPWLEAAPQERSALSVRSAAFLVAAGFLCALAVGFVAVQPQVAKLVRMPWPLGADTRGAGQGALPIVAVLPLTHLDDEAKRGYFSDGVTEDIIVALGRFSGVRVMSRNAVQGFKGKAPALQVVREELGARYIVQGTVRETAGKVRVAVELSDAEKGVLLWADRFDGEGTEVFAIQDRIVKNIVSALHVKVTQLEKDRAFAKPTESLEAYDLVLRARQRLSQIDRRSNREARAHLTRALELSPGYPDAVIVLGEAEIQRSLYGWVEDPAEPMKRAQELGNRALSASDARTHARAHYLMSRVYSNLARPEEALVHAEQAVAANPSDSLALFWQGVSLLYVGRVDEGVAAMEAARRLDPMLSEGNGVNLATGYYTAGRYREALALADQLVARHPRDVASHSLRAASLSQLGEAEKAREAAEQVRRLNPYFDVDYVGLRFANPEHRVKLREGLKKAGL